MDSGAKLILGIVVTSFLILAIVSFAVVASHDIKQPESTMFWYSLDGGIKCDMRQVSKDAYRINCLTEKIK